MAKNGKKTGFHRKDNKGSGKLTVPGALCDSLLWKDKNDILHLIEVIDGKKGIFFYKKDD